MDFIGLGILNGLSYGMVLFLIGAGLSVTLGLMGIANLAHGAFYLVGGYIGWTIAVYLGLDYGLAVLVGGIVAGFIGLAVERGFLRHLHKQIDEQVVLTIGVLFMITNIVLWIWGGTMRPPFTSPYLSGSIAAFGVSYPIHRIAIIGIGIAVFLLLWWIQNKTRLGAMVRCGIDDKDVASSLGINISRLNDIVFFFGAFLAGVAGVLGSQVVGLNIQSGFHVLLLALVVVIVGGIGSIQGALIGALIIGIVDSFGRSLVPGLGMYLTYLLLIIILVARPSGLISRRN